ncbi:MAG TPA: NAD(+) synthase [Anaerolineaceae bacterium]|nr:NAD(+) synthase [Anaerolineaceae bacterium]
MMMEPLLTTEVFQIDVARVAAQISEFIEARRSELHRDGALVALSGGLDSSTVLALTVRAMGAERVKALLLPEKQGNPEAVQYAHQVASWLGVETLTRDLTPILRSLGAYKSVLPRIPTRRARAFAFQAYFNQRSRNPFLQLAHGEGNPLMRHGFAAINIKQRARLVMEYLVAEENNYLVVGCAHKTEDLVGLYVKFGVDDLADIMPLKNLYRTQTLMLAAYLGVPEEIRSRSPNPDIIPGVRDKYLDLLGVPAGKIDLVLYGLEHQLPAAVIADQTGVEVEKVTALRDLMNDTDHMRHPNLAPEFN